MPTLDGHRDFPRLQNIIVFVLKKHLRNFRITMQPSVSIFGASVGRFDGFSVGYHQPRLTDWQLGGWVVGGRKKKFFLKKNFFKKMLKIAKKHVWKKKKFFFLPHQPNPVTPFYLCHFRRVGVGVRVTKKKNFFFFGPVCFISTCCVGKTFVWKVCSGFLTLKIGRKHLPRAEKNSFSAISRPLGFKHVRCQRKKCSPRVGATFFFWWAGPTTRFGGAIAKNRPKTGQKPLCCTAAQGGFGPVTPNFEHTNTGSHAELRAHISPTGRVCGYTKLTI